MDGRKSKLTKERRDKIIALLRAGNTRRVAALAAGIGERTFYDWLKRGDLDCARGKQTQFSQFSQAVARAEAECEVLMVNSVRKAALGYTAPKKRIKTKSHLEEVNGPDGKPLVRTDGTPVTATVTETEVVDFEEFEFMPNMAIEWLKRRRRVDWGDTIDIRKLDDETIVRLLERDAAARVAAGGAAAGADGSPDEAA